MTAFSSVYTLIIVVCGVTLVGICSGIVGTFTYLRQQSLLGDAIAHASLPGIAITFLLSHSTNPYILLGGGAVAGSIGILLMHIVTKKTPLKTDTMLGIVLSVFFGLGLVLLSMIQKLPIAEQSILNKFLFGNAATLLYGDVVMIGIITGSILVCFITCFKSFTIITFDPLFAQSIGYPSRLFNVLLTLLIITAIVIGLQTVGVILISSLLIAPAAAAKPWAKNITHMIIVSGCLGATASISGTIISSCFSHMPTGPIIVIIASIIVCISYTTRIFFYKDT